MVTTIEDIKLLAATSNIIEAHGGEITITVNTSTVIISAGRTENQFCITGVGEDLYIFLEYYNLKAWEPELKKGYILTVFVAC